MEEVNKISQTEEVRNVLQLVSFGSYYELKGKGVKGHVLRALYCSMICLVPMMPSGNYPTYRNIVDYFAQIPDTDTDTNAAIAGGLAGALEGYDEMMKDQLTCQNRIDIEIANSHVFNYQNIVHSLLQQSV